jgi:hypothetical protein
MLTREIPVPLVEILWDDADATNEWEAEIDDVEELVHTVGFLVKESKTSYYISHSVFLADDGTLNWNSKIRIPKGMARSYKILKQAE